MGGVDRSRWEALGPWLDRALELPAEERAGWLESLQGENPAVAAELEALLLESDDLDRQGFLEGPGPDPSPAGQTLGAWTLESPIGRGGMGTVWLARRADGRYEGKAAVKLLNLGLPGRVGQERFRREGSILGRLAHPNIARLIDAGISAGGQPYLVLEYVEGQRIDEYCDALRLDVSSRLWLFLDVLAAVGHAHVNLIVHRDLKPSNVLVDALGQVKLLDFGIAKLLEDESLAAEVTELTREGGRALTPEFAAPEQVQGEPITTATDVYALGVLLYLLLTGRHPVGGGPRPLASLLRAIVETQPPRPSDAVAPGRPEADPPADHAARRATTPDKLARVLRGDLDTIVTKALKKNPQERYASVTALADDLRRFLDHQPISARRDSLAYRAGKFVRRHRVGVISAAAVAVALLATGGFAVRQMLEAERQRRVAEDQAERAETSRDFLENVLSDAGATGRPFTTSELLARAEQSLKAQYGTEASRPAIEQLLSLGVLFAGVDDSKKALEVVGAARDRAIQAGDANLRHQATCELGRQLHYIGRLDEAARLLDGAVAELDAESPVSPDLVDCLLHRSDVDLSRGDVAAGIADASRSLALAIRLSPRSPLRAISARTQLAVARRLDGDLAAAARLYRENLEVLERTGRERSADAAVTYGNWSKVKADAGDILGAVKLMEAAFEVTGAMRPDGPDQVLSVSYGQRLLVLGRLDEAERSFSRAREVARRQDDAEMEALATLGLADIQRERGDCAGATATLRQAEALVPASFPAQHPARLTLRYEFGLLRLACGAPSEAKALLDRVAAEQPGSPVITQVLVRAALARVELAVGDRERAAARAAEASAMAGHFAISGEPSYWVGHCLLVQAEVDRALGNAASARERAARAAAELVPTVGAAHAEARQASALAAR